MGCYQSRVDSGQGVTSESLKQDLPIVLGAERDGFSQTIRPFRAELAANPRHVVNGERRTQLA